MTLTQTLAQLKDTPKFSQQGTSWVNAQNLICDEIHHQLETYEAGSPVGPNRRTA